jgi:hypothetical protein
VPRLEAPLSEAIDRYFSELFARAEAARREAERPAYEALYEAESRELSLEGAEEIESLSWENARLLASEQDLSENMLSIPTAPDEPARELANEDGAEDALASLTHADAVYLHAVLIGDDEERKWVLSSVAASEDSLAEKINLAFTDALGDIVLEPSEDGYIVIEDYMDEVIKWTEKRLGMK